MLKLYVKARMAAMKARKWLAEKQEGMSMIEYVVLGAFIVLFLVGAAVIVGPKLKDFATNTIDDIISGSGR